jgi:hypothetical protein
LKIDDPIVWMNQAGPALELWIAYHLLEQEETKKAGKGRKVDPKEFFNRLYDGEG